MNEYTNKNNTQYSTCEFCLSHTHTIFVNSTSLSFELLFAVVFHILYIMPLIESISEEIFVVHYHLSDDIKLYSLCQNALSVEFRL